MKNCFTACLLLCLLTAFGGCENAESVNPEADRQGAADTTGGGWDCVVFGQVGVDTITRGSYLGLTIGQPARDSYTVLQNLWQQKKVSPMYNVSVVVPDFAQLEQSLPLYSILFLRHGENAYPGVYFTFEEGKVKTIHHYDGEAASPARWPAPEPASSAVVVGDPAATVYKKLSLLKDKAQYAGYFNYLLLRQKEFSQGYDPALASLPEWGFGMPTGTNTHDNIIVNFRQGRISTLYVHHYVRSQ